MDASNLVIVTDDINIVPLESVYTRYGLFIQPPQDHHGNEGFAIINSTTQHQSFRSDNQILVERKDNIKDVIAYQFEQWKNDESPVIVNPRSLTVKVHPDIASEFDIETLIRDELDKIDSN